MVEFCIWVNMGINEFWDQSVFWFFNYWNFVSQSVSFYISDEIVFDKDICVVCNIFVVKEVDIVNQKGCYFEVW